MPEKVFRIFVEKKPGFNIESLHLLNDIKINLGIENLNNIRIINRYDVSGIDETTLAKSINTIFSEPPVDYVYSEDFDYSGSDFTFAIEYLPGQYDQRADSAAQCVQILAMGNRPIVKTAKVYLLSGALSEDEISGIKNYIINPVESHEASLKKRTTLEEKVIIPGDVSNIDGFIDMPDEALEGLLKEYGFAMDFDDLKFCRAYFRDEENRNPSLTELRILDTYWSDHCRHTTFLTELTNIDFEGTGTAAFIKNVFEQYLESRKFVYGNREKDICLMDIATIGMKELRKLGKLNDLDESDEINACSIVVDAEINGQTEKWLVMFKNETHNHPTEIEPFGGAATCLGGAIRDPLSGRSYVYQAMRVTGSGNPCTPVQDTLEGKLPQRKITIGAAQGYSSYGNQIGLATGQVAEIYDEGYVAKRMEIGAVVGAAPFTNVIREKPVPGDLIVLLGGRTGRDGCGGATGSSKAHTEDSIEESGAEVQKGNPPEERKIQRLFRKAEVTRLIKKCNDFGAGGVSVAIGEIADGLEIDLDKVTKKYEGLDGTELAISESQERMAVLVSPENKDKFIQEALKENLEAVVVAEVKAEARVIMRWRGKTIVNISRDFLNSNGAKKTAKIEVVNPEASANPFVYKSTNDISLKWKETLKELNVCSQKGLVERFDGSIGAGSILMPFGGKKQLTPTEVMAAKLPVLSGDTTTATIMAFGYNPIIAKWSPFHSAVYAVVEAVTKIVASGGAYETVRLTLQEYFEKPGTDPKRWAKPFNALLGAYFAQRSLGIPAIGGKDSMSGSFKNLDVPPTLVAFGLTTANAGNIISPEFKQFNSKVILFKAEISNNFLPDFNSLKNIYDKVTKLIKDKVIISASTLKYGGAVEAISKMAVGNSVGFKAENTLTEELLFGFNYGSIICEIPENTEMPDYVSPADFTIIGITVNSGTVSLGKNSLSLSEIENIWTNPLEGIFPTHSGNSEPVLRDYSFKRTSPKIKAKIKTAKPRITITAFPGTNCEYDSAKRFELAGGIPNIFVVRNITPSALSESIEGLASSIDNSQILMLPGGFSAGDEPEGSGKFIATFLRNPRIAESVMNLINKRDGLILGICNGFQALVKLGLLPYGEIRNISESDPTLTFNQIGRHVSTMVRTKIISDLSPWFNKTEAGDIHIIPVSHGEGRFIADKEHFEKMKINGQIATQYVDFNGMPSNDILFNPNGSFEAVEGITSPDGRILGKMGHSERIGINLYKNIPGNKDQMLFESGIEYFL